MVESSVGMLYYNKDLYNRNDLKDTFTNMLEFEKQVQDAVAKEKALDNIYVFGLSLDLKGISQFYL